MSIAHITYTIEQMVTCIVNCTTSNVFLAPVQGAPVLEAPFQVAVVLVAPESDRVRESERIFWLSLALKMQKTIKFAHCLYKDNTPNFLPIVNRQ